MHILYAFWLIKFDFITCKISVVALSCLYNKLSYAKEFWRSLKLPYICRFLAPVCEVAALLVSMVQWPVAQVRESENM